MATSLTFISPTILERLENGSFVPTRRASRRAGARDDKAKDRRNVISPLPVTKKCIRYEPNVFHHRKDTILGMAHSLNNPLKKIFLVGGAQGSGKTSLVRGLIELMGSRNEQLLWFDVTRHTDFEEIIQFLIQYITYVCTTRSEQSPASATTEATPIRSRPPGTLAEAPLQKLEALIQQVQDMPLLIVLDNVEYIVDSEFRFNSYPFKEMLNFLLDFPNIKMVLVGERLPYADMSPNQEGVSDIRLAGLPEAEILAFMHAKRRPVDEQPGHDPAILERAAAPDAELAALRQLYAKTQGYPWLLKAIFYLHHRSRLDFYTLNRMLDSELAANEGSGAGASGRAPLPVTPLVRFIYKRLPDEQRRLFQVLCFLRHPVNAATLQALMGVCFPVLGPSGVSEESIEDILEHSLIRPVTKVSFPPQEVLAHIRQHQELLSPADGERRRKFKPWYELYHQVKRMLYHNLSTDERARMHGVLQDFYLREKGQEQDTRIMRLKNRVLLAEAKFHASSARGRNGTRGTSNPPPPTISSVEPNLAGGLTLPATGGRPSGPLTLDDYRRIQLPESAPEPDMTDTTPMLSASSTDGDDGPEASSFQEYLAGLQLSDEEQALLKESTTTLTRGALPALDGSMQGNASADVPLDRLPSADLLTHPPSPATPEATPETVEVHTAAELNQVATAVMRDTDLDEQERTIQQRLASAVASRDKPAMAEHLLALAQYRASMGRYQSAGQCLEKALGLKATLNPELQAELYRVSGVVNKETYHHNAALASLSKAAVQIKRLMYQDDTVDAVWLGRLGEVYHHLGEIQAYRRQHAAALESFTQALRWYQSADDELHQAEVCFQMAEALEQTGQSEDALVYYHRALALDEANQHHLSAAAALVNIAALQQAAGQTAEALAGLQRALAYDRQAGNTEGQLVTLERMAAIHADAGRWVQAEALYQQGLTLAMQEGSHMGQANFYVKLGRLAEEQQQWAQAIQYYGLARSSGQNDLSQDSLHWLDEQITNVQAHMRA